MRKRFPMEADSKLNVEVGGRARLRISRWRWERIERIRSACAVGIGVQRQEVPVRRVINSDSASEGDEGRRWLKRVRIGAWVGGIRRTRRPMETQLIRLLSLSPFVQDKRSNNDCKWRKFARENLLYSLLEK